jgi:glycosyltransferase involved in cell wall biosynthesis
MTDAWCAPYFIGGKWLPNSFRGRWHPHLKDARVVADSGYSIFKRIADLWGRESQWASIIDRNLHFQKWAAAKLSKRPSSEENVFAYSYAAAAIFEEAKRSGRRTVLGQIDPGPVEARLVADLYGRAGQGHVHEPIPDRYWRLWRREIELADKIVVNSAWSHRALVAEGVAPEKIAVIPLAYEGRSEVSRRRLPASFTPERPLRLLFLGQVTLRKGIGVIFEALRLLPDAPLRLDIVGPLQVEVPEGVANDARVTFHGIVARSETHAFYGHADLFLFPTHSDGFGLTQLEALAAGLPVIASKFCGDVVRDGVDGHILASLEPQTLAVLLRELLADPGRVARLQRGAMVDGKRFGLDAIGQQLQDLFA